MTSCAETPAPPAPSGASLWRHRDFRRYLTGQAASVAGSSITQMALPVLAVLHLDATTAQVAWLAFLGQLPPALLALHAGALADRCVNCTKSLIMKRDDLRLRGSVSCKICTAS